MGFIPFFYLSKYAIIDYNSGGYMETKNIKKKLVKEFMNQEMNEENEKELIDMLIDNSVSIDVDKMEDEARTKGDILADKVSEVAGSWPFIICFTTFLIIWIMINYSLASSAPDPYPFILLNLILSCIAALQAPIIMMSQNRQAKKDSIRNQNDYKVDLKSELILEELHDKINVLLSNQKTLLKRIDELETKKKK